ncbi:protein kinase domain-containing protein [Dictyobacter formicarum]|uniref:non-specific serine/threonine protein kinase n=1 Tax=Dictyobacter formicarum TaxID=2778368 RepID=A0ABQ3V8V3_9CHLR|nr:NERD domain-containing protein [Dictyobacter formicarum]GHO82264.1 protein kinase [Dictyobacter formicarum]
MAELISAGPSSFATEGERQAATVLQQQLPADWIIICNKILPTNDDRSFEIDFIIIGKNWVFLLDEKSWHGRIRGDDEQWIRANGSSERSPLAKIDYTAKIFAGQLGYKVTPLKQGAHYVRGGVLLSVQEVYPQIHDNRATHGVFLLSDACQRLQKLDQQGGNPAVGQWSAKIKEALLHLNNRPEVPKSINFLKIDDAVSLRPNVRLFYASVEDDPTDVRHLLVYNLGKNPLQAKELADFYKQEYKTIKKLQSTGLVPDVQDPFIWSEDYLIVTITPPKGKSLKATPLPETREEFVQELQLAAACFKGLDQIHAQGVLHRALGPETIYVQSKQPAKITFTNFYAARMGTNTIAPSLDALSFEDPYASIDVAIGYEYATIQTDTFSMALILLERLSGTAITKLRTNVEGAILFPDQPRWSSFLVKEQADQLHELFKELLQPPDNTQITAKAAGTRLAELAHNVSNATKGEEGRILCKDFRIQRVLGQGMMARTYLVSNINYQELGSYVLKQFLRTEEVNNQAVAEYKALKGISSIYLPRIDFIFAPDDDAHILMEHIPGPTLQQVESEFPWPLDRWWSFAQHLLNAVEILEQKALLHRDIKPANIMLHESNNHPVLIDFGFAMQIGENKHIAGTPLYLPPEAKYGEPTPASTDRYAAAIVLFQTLTGLLPFTKAPNGQRDPISLDQFVETRIRRIATVLQRATANDPDQRPTTIGQLRDDLQLAFMALEEPVTTHELEKQINPWVDNIRSLYRNSDSGNMNNRGLDSEFVRETYIATALDKELLPAIFEQLPHVLFLSGNPGDGKTAFLEKVFEELKQRGGQIIDKNPSGWSISYKEHTFRSCYDASESHEHLSADEQLSEKLQGLEGSTPPTDKVTVLVAINDGRLFDFFQRRREQFFWMGSQIDQLTDRQAMTSQDVWLVDMKQRAFVSLPGEDEHSIFQPMLARFVQPQHWTICESCSAQDICPIRKNALALKKKAVASRLEYLFLLIHLRRQRHITMRDLRSAVSYILTGNKSCQDIHDLNEGTEIGTSLTNLAYWQNIFMSNNTHDELLEDIASLDPARFARPHLDRFLHFHQLESDALVRRQIFRDKQDIAPQRFKSTTDWMAAAKRRLYFEAAPSKPEAGLPEIKWKNLLPYRYAARFIDLLNDRIDPEAVLKNLALGLLRSDEVFEDVPDDKLSVKVSASAAQQLVVLKQLPLDDFELIVSAPQHTQLIETLPEMVVLQHKSGTPRMEITLDLFELLIQLASGLQPNAREYASLLEDLKPFKNALLLRETQELILIESEFRTHHIAQRDGKIIREQIVG